MQLVDTEKFICKNNENSKQVNKVNDNFDLIQVLGNKFENKESCKCLVSKNIFSLSGT